MLSHFDNKIPITNNDAINNAGMIYIYIKGALCGRTIEDMH